MLILQKKGGEAPSLPLRYLNVYLTRLATFIFDEVTFARFTKFSLPLRIKINTWLFTLKLIVIEDSCCKPVSLPRFVSGKLIPILFYLPAESFFNISSKALPILFPRKVQGLRHSPFISSSSFDKAWPLAAAFIYINLVITNKAPFAATASRLAFTRL